MLNKVLGGAGIFLILAYLSIAIAFIAGWINNILWLITNTDPTPVGQLIVSIVGILVAPVGAVHGLWVW